MAATLRSPSLRAGRVSDRRDRRHVVVLDRHRPGNGRRLAETPRLQWRSPGGVPERPKGTGCKPVGSAFRGSNPRAPIIIITSPSHRCALLLGMCALRAHVEFEVAAGRGEIAYGA
jgi:hypothetical protein